MRGWLSRGRGTAIAELEAWIAGAPRVGGPFCVAVFGPKDPKTSTALAIARALAQRGEATVVVDANPDFGTLRAQLAPAGSAPPARTLLDLAVALTEPDPDSRLVLSGFADLDPFLERVGPNLYVISNDGVKAAALAGVTREQYAAAFAALRRQLPVTVIDQGRTQAGPVTDAILQAADHLVIPVPAAGVELNKVTAPASPTSPAGGALVQLAERGYRELVAGSTLAVTGLSPELDPAGIVAELAGYAGRGLFAVAVAVPYDAAVAGKAPDRLAEATRLAYLQVSAQVVAAMGRPRLARQAQRGGRAAGHEPAGGSVRTLRPAPPSTDEAAGG